MRFPRTYVLAFLSFLLTLPALSQQSATSTAQRDPQALAILNKCLNSAGDASVVMAIQDFSATGNITYYWNEPIQGTMTVRGRGTDQFRLDATLPIGVRSSVVSYGTGSITDIDGTLRRIPPNNAINFGSVTFPLIHLVAALQDTTIRISYVGLVTQDGLQAVDIRLQKVFDPTTDPGSIRSNLTTRDFLIDQNTFQVLEIRDALHGNHDPNESYPHTWRFSDYRPVSGLLTPFSISETMGNQPTLAIQLTQITFNVGLSDADFQPQNPLELMP